MNIKLQKIAEKYKKVQHNTENYEIGGGLSGNAFASRRHEDAKYDEGKLTLGKANQVFSKATGLEVEVVKEVIESNFSLEWHHAGKIPKAYGGGMKKTYFLNSEQIVELAENFEKILKKTEAKKEADKLSAEKSKNRSILRQEFLKENGIFFERKKETPRFYVEKYSEMLGKNGYFSTNHKYNCPVYYTGWELTEENFKKYYEI